MIVGLVWGMLTKAQVITQCEIRKLYARKDEAGIREAIEVAKQCERRRCGHHPDECPEPLSTVDCLQSVVDAKKRGENKHRYVVASQSQEVRRMLRGVRGVPLIYIKRSVMIMEPMSDESAQLRAREERGKFRAEIKTASKKRRRDDSDVDGDQSEGSEEGKTAESRRPKALVSGEDEEESKKKKLKKRRGPKEPNPLSVMKAKKQKQAGEERHDKKESTQDADAVSTGPGKRKRRKKAKAEVAATSQDTNRTAIRAAGSESDS